MFQKLNFFLRLSEEFKMFVGGEYSCITTKGINMEQIRRENYKSRKFKLMENPYLDTYLTFQDSNPIDFTSCSWPTDTSKSVDFFYDNPTLVTVVSVRNPVLQSLLEDVVDGVPIAFECKWRREYHKNVEQPISIFQFCSSKGVLLVLNDDFEADANIREFLSTYSFIGRNVCRYDRKLYDSFGDYFNINDFQTTFLEPYEIPLGFRNTVSYLVGSEPQINFLREKSDSNWNMSPLSMSQALHLAYEVYALYMCYIASLKFSFSSPGLVRERNKASPVLGPVAYSQTTHSNSAISHIERFYQGLSEVTANDLRSSGNISGRLDSRTVSEIQGISDIIGHRSSFSTSYDMNTDILDNDQNYNDELDLSVNVSTPPKYVANKAEPIGCYDGGNSSVTSYSNFEGTPYRDKAGSGMPTPPSPCDGTGCAKRKDCTGSGPVNVVGNTYSSNYNNEQYSTLKLEKFGNFNIIDPNNLSDTAESFHNRKNHNNVRNYKNRLVNEYNPANHGRHTEGNYEDNDYAENDNNILGICDEGLSTEVKSISRISEGNSQLTRSSALSREDVNECLSANFPGMSQSLMESLPDDVMGRISQIILSNV